VTLWLTGETPASYVSQNIGTMGSTWTVEGVRDFNGDGKADVLWRNSADGDLVEWLSNSGTGYTGYTSVDFGDIPSAWVTVADNPPALSGQTNQAVVNFAQSLAGGRTGAGAAQILASAALPPTTPSSVLAGPGGSA